MTCPWHASSFMTFPRMATRTLDEALSSNVSQVALVGLKIDGGIMAQTGWLLYTLVRSGRGRFYLHHNPCADRAATSTLRLVDEILAQHTSGHADRMALKASPLEFRFNAQLFFEKRTSPRTQRELYWVNPRLNLKLKLANSPLPNANLLHLIRKWGRVTIWHSAPTPPWTQQWPWDHEQTQHIWIILNLPGTWQTTNNMHSSWLIHVNPLSSLFILPEMDGLESSPLGGLWLGVPGHYRFVKKKYPTQKSTKWVSLWNCNDPICIDLGTGHRWGPQILGVLGIKHLKHSRKNHPDVFSLCVHYFSDPSPNVSADSQCGLSRHHPGLPASFSLPRCESWHVMANAWVKECSLNTPKWVPKTCNAQLQTKL